MVLEDVQSRTLKRVTFLEFVTIYHDIVEHELLMTTQEPITTEEEVA